MSYIKILSDSTTPSANQIHAWPIRPIDKKLNFVRWTSHCPRYRTFYRFIRTKYFFQRLKILSSMILVEPSSDESNLKMCSIYVPWNIFVVRKPFEWNCKSRDPHCISFTDSDIGKGWTMISILGIMFRIRGPGRRYY